MSPLCCDKHQISSVERGRRVYKCLLLCGRAAQPYAASPAVAGLVGRTEEARDLLACDVDESEHPVIQQMAAIHANHEVTAGLEELVSEKLAV
jgi:hypothetical protein